jgi:hypothetical protein
MYNQQQGYTGGGRAMGGRVLNVDATPFDGYNQGGGRDYNRNMDQRPPQAQRQGHNSNSMPPMNYDNHNYGQNNYAQGQQGQNFSQGVYIYIYIYIINH